MVKKILVVYFIFFSNVVFSDVQCKGKIISIHKWDTFETISIMIDGANRWISMPTQSDESMALLAFASDKEVTIQWVDTNVTSCTNGWNQNAKLKGWWGVDK